MSVKQAMMHESAMPMPCETCEVRSKLHCLKPNPEGSNQAGRHAVYRVPAASNGINRLPIDGQSAAYRAMSPGVRMSGRPNPRYSATRGNFRIAYGARAPRQRSLHSSPRSGKPVTWRREAGVSMDYRL